MPSFLNPIFLLAMLIALSVHEAAHAYVAYKLGDHTAKVAGRMTLNPIAHLDPMGTILFFLVGFGWGKPVPVNPYYFKHPVRDGAITAFAGPVSNFLLAFVSFLTLHFGLGYNPLSLGALMIPSEEVSVLRMFGENFLSSMLFLNLGLMAFNLLPVAPLDGSKVLHLFIPVRLQDDYDRFMEWGPYLLLALLIAGSFTSLDILSTWIMAIMEAVLRGFSMMVGA